MSAKLIFVFIAISCVFVFSWSLYRDVQLEKQYAGDLRNRVVGARMQKDGRSPYFYKWKKGDGLRYYDPSNFDSLKVSNITASPFYHHLLYPISDLPQRSISKIWLFAQYSMLFIMVMMGVALARNNRQQWLVIITACIFLLTETWKMHVGNGQNYIVIPLLCMSFYYFINSTKSLARAFAAGVCAVALVLIKPNAVLFFIPFLFLFGKYSMRYIAVFILPLVIAGVWILSSSSEIFLWKQYGENIEQQIKVHQHEFPVVQINERDPGFNLWEGMDQQQMKRDSILHPVHIYSENGNVFVLSTLLFHARMNKSVLFILSCCCIALLVAVFYLKHRATGFTPPPMAFAGFCLFMISDLFSPVYRHQYYTVQWLFPLLLSAAVYKPVQKKIYLLIAAGLILNVLNIAFIPMEHTIGEYIMLVAFIVLSLRRETGLNQ